jgi:hypothetical protein
MALNSPGVEVQVKDESFYVPAEPGTRPLIVVASQQNKINGSGTGVAVGTLAANAGKPYLITSQRELTETFGKPLFYKDSSQNPIHGGEINEYGLQAAYSYLGVSNSAYIVRADLDLAELEPSASSPSADPTDGTYWFDVQNTRFGIFEWNGSAATVKGGQKFTNKIPTVITDSTKLDPVSGAPVASVGKIGDYVVVAVTTLNKIYFKNRSNDWVLVGSNDWYRSWPVVTGTQINPANIGPQGNSLYINGTEVVLSSGTTLEALASDINNASLRGISAAVVDGRLELYSDGAIDLLNVVTAAGTGVDGETSISVTNASGTIHVGDSVSGTNIANGTRVIAYDSNSGVVTIDTQLTGVVNSTVSFTTSSQDSTLSNEIVIAKGQGTLVNTNASDSLIGIATGVYLSPALQISPHTNVPLFKRKDLISTSKFGRPSGSIWIKTTDVNLGARWRIKEWSSNISDWVLVNAPIYSTNHEAIYALDRVGGGKNIATGTLFVQFDVGEDSGSDDTPRVATFKIFRREQPDPTTITSEVITASTFTSGYNYSFQIAVSEPGVRTLTPNVTVSFTAHAAVSDAAALAAAINSKNLANVIAEVDTRNRVVIKHELGGEIRFLDGIEDLFQDPLNPGVVTGTRMAPISMIFTPYDVNTSNGTANFYNTPSQSGYYISTGSLDQVDGYTMAGDTKHDYVMSNWKPLKYVASESAPNTIPTSNTLWYSNVLTEVDIMIHNGVTWVGYLDPTSPYYDSDENFKTDPNGPIVSATKPTTQSDGTTLRDGDLWIDSSDRENYPALYKWDGYNLVWNAVDTADQTTEEGIIFADARYNTNGVNSNMPGDVSDLLYSNFLDTDAPDPALYPRGMLLFNTRRSGNNVKKFVRNYIDINSDNIRYNGNISIPVNTSNGESMMDYYPHRWVNESGNAADGRGLFGRKAQRKVVVKHLKSLVDTNQDIRDQEIRTFNLITCPGYCELISNMVNLNTDRKQTAFVIGDSPFRLTSDATSITNWASNAALAVDNGEEGLITFDEYLGVYYPSGYTTDNDGNNIVVPASHMVLRTIALSDNVSFPWFAPAGTRRGAVTNATSVGYVNVDDGEWKSISLNEGQRDALYAWGVNPVTFMTGSGIVVFGQKTRAKNASSLDRVNVARLVVYLRGQLSKLAKPYIFEPNDKITRDELKAGAESIMLELVGQRALYDYLVVCDESNNTPSRIDRNELYLDIAIEPVKAVEFIYIPLRLKNTGEIAGLGKA